MRKGNPSSRERGICLEAANILHSLLAILPAESAEADGKDEIYCDLKGLFLSSKSSLIIYL